MRSPTTGSPDQTHLRAHLRQETTTSASDRTRFSRMRGRPETGGHDSISTSSASPYSELSAARSMRVLLVAMIRFRGRLGPTGAEARSQER